MKLTYYLYLVVLLVLAGCASTVTVVKDKDNEDGIPFYLPKPYLLITKNLPSVGTKLTTTTERKQDGTATTVTVNEPVPYGSEEAKKGDLFSFQIIYLPDLAERYRLKIKSGTGTIDTTITLVDGWKFTGLNLKADAKTSETIQAVGSAFKSVAEIAKLLAPEALKQLEAPVEAKVWLYEIRVEKDKIEVKPVFEWPPQQQAVSTK